MDPITLIVTALATGALKGTGDTAAAAVSDAYLRLKEIVSSRLARAPSAELVLNQHEADPETFEGPMTRLVRETGLAHDEAIIAAAAQVLELLKSSGTQAAKYVVDVRSSPGTVIGDHTTVTQRFDAQPRP